MAEISAKQVKELRDATGAGMGDCKKALVDANGDMKEAIEILRKKGAASASKRADRSANEGLIVAKTSPDNKKSIVAEVNSETDFVAKNQEFVKFANIIGDTLLASDCKTVEELMKEKVGSETVEQLYNSILAAFAEKIQVRRFERVTTNGYITDYIHAGSKLAVLLEVSISNPDEEVKQMIRDIAMQIAAMNPSYIDRSVIPQAVLDKELEIYKESAINEGKKPEIAEKIAQGRLDKFYQEQCLLEQIFVRDSSKTIADFVKDISAKVGSDVKVLSFRRFFLGEELEA